MTKAVKWLIIVLFAAVLVYMAYFSYSVYRFSININSDSLSDRFQGMKEQAVNFQPPEWDGNSRVNVLVMGGDARGLKKGEIPRSDTLLVASIDPSTKKGVLFSVMRDTWVAIPGHGHDRVNTALSIGGPKLAMETVGNLLGIPIQYYVYTDFQGFIALVNSLGGVPIEVEKDMNYVDNADGNRFDIHLKKGLQNLNGEQALQYVRFRHDARSDFARTERQRTFLKALADQLRTTTGIMKLPQMLTVVSPYVETNMEFSQLLQLTSLAYQAKDDTITGIQIPPMTLLKETTKRGAAVLDADPEQLKSFVQEAFSK